MILPHVTVELERNERNFWVGRVVQQDASGPVYGRNLLSSLQYTTLEPAQEICTQVLRSKAKQIDFKVLCE